MAPRQPSALTVRLSGPFFEHDPRKTVRQNIRAMLEAVALEAQEDVRSNFPVLTGAGRAGVVGRVASLKGKHWELHATISQQHVYPWARRSGATIRSGRNVVANSANAAYRGGKLERKLHMFSHAATSIRRAKAVINADLTAGLT